MNYPVLRVMPYSPLLVIRRRYPFARTPSARHPPGHRGYHRQKAPPRRNPYPPLRRHNRSGTKRLISANSATAASCAKYKPVDTAAHTTIIYIIRPPSSRSFQHCCRPNGIIYTVGVCSRYSQF